MDFKTRLKNILEMSKGDRLDDLLEWIHEFPEQASEISTEEVNILGIILELEDYETFIDEINSINICSESHEQIPEGVTCNVFMRLTVSRYYGVIPEVEITLN